MTSVGAAPLHLSASSHVDVGDVIGPVSKHINVHIETNEEVLLGCLQELFQEHDVPVQIREVKGEMLPSGCVEITDFRRTFPQQTRLLPP